MCEFTLWTFRNVTKWNFSRFIIERLRYSHELCIVCGLLSLITHDGQYDIDYRVISTIIAAVWLPVPRLRVHVKWYNELRHAFMWCNITLSYFFALYVAFNTYTVYQWLTLYHNVICAHRVENNLNFSVFFSVRNVEEAVKKTTNNNSLHVPSAKKN